MAHTTGGRSSAQVAAQLDELVRDHFTIEDALDLGTFALVRARQRGLPIVIEVHHGAEPVFSAALPGSVPDSREWIRRKGNVVRRWHRSTLELRLRAEEDGTTFHEAWGVPESEFAAHGGGIPIRVRGVGIVGAIYASGLPQLDDHDFLVECLRATLPVSRA